MRLVQSEKLIRDKSDNIICYTTQNISRVFSVYAMDTWPIKIGIVQFNGRQVTLDCADIPDGVPIYITYFSDNSQTDMDIIPVWKMIEEVYNKFWGRNYCRLSEEYIQEKIIYNINYLNRTKVNTYFNKQFCFSRPINEMKCIEIEPCGEVDYTIPENTSSCGCGNSAEPVEDCGIYDEVVEVKKKKRFFLPEGAPKSGILRFSSGEYVEYNEIEDWVHLNSQHNIESEDYVIGYWIPSTDIVSVTVWGKPTMNYDLYNNFIFLKNKDACDVCIEYVERYSECTAETQCVEFDHTFWKLPVYATIIEIATDESDDRLGQWTGDYTRMKRDYSIITGRAGMDFSHNPNHIYTLQNRYNPRYTSTQQKNAYFFSDTQFKKKWGCTNCK